MLNHYVLIVAVLAVLVGKSISNELKRNKYEMVDTEFQDDKFEVIQYGVIKNLILTLEVMRKRKEVENDKNTRLGLLKRMIKTELTNDDNCVQSLISLFDG